MNGKMAVKLQSNGLSTIIEKLLVRLLLVFITGITATASLTAQPLLQAWGNLDGIRVEGQLMELNSSLRLEALSMELDERGKMMVDSTGGYLQTYKEAQRPQYQREGNTQVVKSALGGVNFTQQVTHLGKGEVKLTIGFKAEEKVSSQGAFLFFRLPGAFYSRGALKANTNDREMEIEKLVKTGETYTINAGNLRLTTSKRDLEVKLDREINWKLQKANNGDLEVYLPVLSAKNGKLKKGAECELTATITVNGEIDRKPVTISVDTTNPGRKFDGLGGNFRLQNRDTDPQVINYNLDNLRVAWGRVELPWALWHPEEDVDPYKAAEEGNLHPHVKGSMIMAQKLAERGMPVVLGDWSAPDWAIIGKRTRGLGPDGKRGNRLKPDKMEKIYDSITKYVLFLKNHFGVEAVMFSFNESDLGIDVRQTAEEHAELIKGLGAHFAAQNLKTKMVLGDASDANGHWFIEEAMNDPETHKYIGAVSFHSWRGWETETLQKWDDAADELNVPLLVGEGSTDAAAWKYPQIFDERSFAMKEIILYTRILNICQPKSILQWQLTADYSILAGGGVFGNDEEPLHPMQRFWNLKQVAATPKGVFALPVKADRPEVYTAAFGNRASRDFTVHVANNGAERQVTLRGLPAYVTKLRKVVTDHERGMQEEGLIPVKNGEARFRMDAVSFISLYSVNHSHWFNPFQPENAGQE